MAIQYTLWGGKTNYRSTRSMRKGALIGWLALTFCAATGAFVSKGDWYADLVKPTWNPPGWVFGPVWTALYIMMAVAAWLVWRQGGWKRQRRPLTLYLMQWLLNAIWTPLFFALHQPGWAFAEILVLLATILVTILMFGRVRLTAALLLVPYALWTAFAAVLNFTIWRLNA
jgi:benzodiazapine receptor